MESLIMGLLGIFGITEPLITVDVKVDVNINLPGVERELDDISGYGTDELFIDRR